MIEIDKTLIYIDKLTILPVWEILMEHSRLRVEIDLILSEMDIMDEFAERYV